jgi:hypothetical protein
MTGQEQVKKTGRPKNINYNALSNEDVQAVDKSKVQWRYLALKLAAQCEGYVKRGEPIPGQLLTQAAIAYDKAFSKADQTDTTVAIPTTLERAIVKALVSDNAHNVYQVPRASVITPSSDTGSVMIHGQGQGLVADHAIEPGVGLRSDPDAVAGAAYQAVSPARTEPENNLENQKDPAQVQAEGRSVNDQALAPDGALAGPVTDKPRGPKRFVDPFKK